MKKQRGDEELTLSNEEFDRRFDAGEDISDYLDFSAAQKVEAFDRGTKKVNVDFPRWVVEELDKEARRIGVTRQSIIKMWIAERLKEEKQALKAG